MSLAEKFQAFSFDVMMLAIDYASRMVFGRTFHEMRITELLLPVSAAIELIALESLKEGKL